MPHHERSTIIVIVRACDIVGELSACRRQFTLLLSALLVVVEFATISGMKAPPSTESSMGVPAFLSEVREVFVVVSSLGESASSYTTASPFSVRVRIEHVSFRCGAPCSDVVFFNQ